MHQRGPHYEAQERISSHTDMLMHKYSPLHALSRVLSGKMTPPLTPEIQLTFLELMFVTSGSVSRQRSFYTDGRNASLR